MNIIDASLLNEVTTQAKKSDRLRMNYNFHTSVEAKSQRLLNALEPGTVLPIHRHRYSDETYIILKGCLNVLFFDDNKKITEQIELNSKKNLFGINIPKGQWHTIEVLDSGTVIFECKDGPYMPLDKNDLL